MPETAIQLSRRDGAANTLFADADKLLRFAEELQEKCDRYELNGFLRRAIGLLAVVVFIGLEFIGAEYPIRDTEMLTHIAFTIIPALCAGLVVSFSGLFEAKIRRFLRRDRRALQAIVDMLREVEKGVVEQNGLSALERAGFHIRLSRFDIGPGWRQ